MLRKSALKTGGIVAILLVFCMALWSSSWWLPCFTNMLGLRKVVSHTGGKWSDQVSREVVSNPIDVTVGDQKNSGFVVDPTKPWMIVLGRGSGQMGYDTICLDQNGAATVYRHVTRGRSLQLEKLTLLFPPDRVSMALASLKENGIYDLASEYHAKTHDGTQWVLRVVQGSQSKDVFCDNNFPQGIVSLATTMDGLFQKTADGLFQKNGITALPWAQVPDSERVQQSQYLKVYL
jgi:hypothetical protein